MKLYRNALECGRRDGNKVCKLPPSAHGVEADRRDVEASHPFEMPFGK